MTALHFPGPSFPLLSSYYLILSLLEFQLFITFS